MQKEGNEDKNIGEGAKQQTHQWQEKGTDKKAEKQDLPLVAVEKDVVSLTVMIRSGWRLTEAVAPAGMECICCTWWLDTGP